MFQQNKKLGDLCTLGIGGPARYFIEVRTPDQMTEVLTTCLKQNYPFFIMGKGSNCLFSEKGFDGVVIQNRIEFLERMDRKTYHVGAGYSFSLLGVQTAREGLSGLEFASGIPASVGGAVFMNAGANGQETCDTLVSVDYVDISGTVHTLPREELQFSYRQSCFQEKKGAITGATFRLNPVESARSKQIQIVEYRSKTQPYGEKSAGCAFRNPKGHYAGAIIEQCGLKGKTWGGAKVSEKHANFIINTGNASSEDVKSLMNFVRDKVKCDLGIVLESEIRIIDAGILEFKHD